jgi:SRSO17 transposase
MQECIPASDYQQLHHFISHSPWDAFGVIGEVARKTQASLAGLSGSQGLLLDETGPPGGGWEKAGQKSVGVARQYIGNVGKVTNAQVGVFAALCKGDKVGLVSARLYLPQAWSEDCKRCEQAGIPLQQQTYQSKPQLAEQMLNELAAQVSYDWVGGDAIYGNSPGLRAYLIAHQQAFVLDVGQELKVYRTDPQPFLPVAPLGKGRKPTQLVSKQTPMALKELIQPLPQEQWQTLTYRQGSKGALQREATLLRVWLWKAQDQKDPQQLYLLISRDLDGSELKYSLCYQPEAAPDLATCLYRQMQRYGVERAFQEVKQQLGLNQYQVRSWTAWYHHIALTMMALHFMLQTQVEQQEDLPLLSCSDIKLLLAKTLANKLHDPLGLWSAIEQRHLLPQQDINLYQHRYQT